MTKARPPLLTATELAAQIRPRVTIRAVSKWKLIGLPSSGKKRGRHALYDLAQCQAWVNANVQRVHGGNHGGPKKGRRDAPASAPVVDPTAALAGLRTSDDVMGLMDRGGATVVGMHTFERAIKSAAALNELNVASGKLVSVEDVKETWATTLQIVRTMLDGLAARITRSVVAITPLERATETAMREAITAEAVRVLGDLERGAS